MPILFRLSLLSIFLLTGCASSTTTSSSDSGFPLPAWATGHSSVNNAATNNSSQHVVLLVPLQGNLAPAGQAVKAGFMAANQGSNTQVDVVDTSQYPSINSAYAVAEQKKPDIIVGPLSKADVAQLQQQNLSVPTIALNYTDENSALPNNLYEFALSPLDEARQIADRASQDNHHAALIIYPNGAWGKTVAGALQSEWQQQNGTVVGSTMLSGNDSDFNTQIRNLLQANGTTQSHRQDMDVIFLVASPEQARVIEPLLKYYFVSDVPIYATSMVYSGISQPALNNDLNGIKFCDMPWLLNNNSNQLTQTYNGTQLRLYAFGMDAYQLTQQLNKIGTTPNAGISGATGELYLDQQRVHRQLQWAQFQNGQAVRIS